MLCTLTGVRDKPGGRENANRGKRRERRKTERKTRRKGREKKERRRKIKCIRPVRLRVCAKIKASIFLKGNFDMLQIIKKTVALWVFLVTDAATS